MVSLGDRVEFNLHIDPSKRTRTIGLLCFFSSGACGLIYEVVWSRFFALYVGNTASSHTLVITSFMAGLAVGYYVFGTTALRFRSGLRTYAVLEWIISAYALAFIFVYPLVANLVMDWVKPFGPGAAITNAARWSLGLASLVPPTVLMGGTLPLLVHHFRPLQGQTAQAAANLYGWNSAGAVVGCLSAGLLWIPQFGISTTMIAAAIVNAIVAAVAWYESRATHVDIPPANKHDDAKTTSPAEATNASPIQETNSVGQSANKTVPSAASIAEQVPVVSARWLVFFREIFGQRNLSRIVRKNPEEYREYAAGIFVGEAAKGGQGKNFIKKHQPPRRSAITHKLLLVAFFSGLLSFSLQSLWIRLFSLVFGSSTYSFTIVIASCIFGITLGSWTIHRWIRRRKASFTLLSVLFGTVCVTLWSQAWMYEQLPWLFAHVRLVLPDTPEAFPIYLGIQACIVSIFVILPTGTLAMMLPIVIDLGELHGPNAPKTTGVAFAVNSIGCVTAAALATHILTPALGARGLFVVITATCGLLSTVMCIFNTNTGGQKKWTGVLVASLLTLVAILMPADWNVQVLNSGEFRNRRSQMPNFEQFSQVLKRGELLFHEDAPDATVVVVGKGQHRVLRVNGKADASTGGDMITQVASAHIPLLFSVDPRKVLIIGLGSGVTAGSAAKYGAQVDVVEISSAVIRASQFFESVNNAVSNNCRVAVIEEDAKAFLRLVDTRYDVIISEPSNPWIAGTASLFSVDFFEELKQHLTEDGVLAQWLHLYEVSNDQVDMIIATLATSFPHFTIWELFPNDLIVLAGTKPLDLDLARARDRFGLPEIVSDLERVGIVGLPSLLSLQLLSENTARNLRLRATGLNRDIHPRLEFLAPIGLFRGDRATRFDTIDQRLEPLAHTDLLLNRWNQTYGVKNEDWENIFRLHTLFPGSPPEFRLGLVDGFLAASTQPFLVALLHTLTREKHYREAEKVADQLLAKYPTDPDVLYPSALVESLRMSQLGTSDARKLTNLLQRCVQYGDDRLNRCGKWLTTLQVN
ncbi:MAG: fused MFS/spermidine synthase [Myxococcales bacterium]|nr:fused MFS/spermidine synthase [Myxococcales bacterium]